jgi:RHS repeat-associated protein
MRSFACAAGLAGTRRAVATLAAGALASALLAACSGNTTSAAHPAPPVSPGVPVKVTPVAPKHVRVRNEADRVFRATAIRWPAAGSGSALLRAPAAGELAGPAARIAGTPVWVQALADGSTDDDAYQGPSLVSATVLSHARAVALGVSGVVFRVGGGGPATGTVRVGLDYGAFSQVYGGNYGSRLRLVALPACALTTPQVKACRRQTPLDSSQDYKASSVSAVVSLGTAQTATLTSYTTGAPGAALTSSGAEVIGATDSTGQEGGEGGTYAASKLRPSGTWSEGGDSGAFTYTYPITVPSASTQLVPSVSLDYDSQEVDGQTATTQTQSSWLGDGWQTPDSFIALETTPCDDDPEGSASPDATTDECYDGEVVQMSLDGTDTPLVFVSSSTSGGVTTSQWRAEDDDGAVITHVSDSATVFGAYSLGADYWTVAERDGTKYEFGLQHLPGWASGDAATSSVDTMPVYSAHSGDPCYSSSGFAASVCTMAYEWHLDYVVDTHSEAMAYYYTQTSNYYGEDGGAKDVSYVSDSYLSQIDYGFLAGQAYGTVPDKVVFTAAPRCVASTCGALSTSNADVATQYPDVPVDLLCGAGTTCAAYAPSLFSQVRLASITTEQYSESAGGYEDVDTYTFTQTEPASGDGLAPTLWLASIGHTGDDTSAGGSSSPVSLPVVSFAGTDLPNRVFTSTYPGLYRYRISAITTEMGAVTSVSYGTPDPCSSSYSSSSPPSVTSANTDSCFPVYWTPEGDSSPVLDWFNSYAVTQVLTTDTTGGSLTQESDYSYGGGAAWHYDDNQAVQPKYRTWGQFRGYATVTTRTGQAANNPQTETETAYYRGMNGDTLPSGTSSVTLTDSQGGSHVDADQLAGDPLETTTYLGAGGPVESSTITSYWVSAAAATMNPAGLPPLTANMVEPAETWTQTALTDGGESGDWRVTETDDSYDPTVTDADFGLLEYSYSHTDPVNTAYDSCTRDQYAPVNTGENLVGLISYTETDQVACSGYTAGSPASVPAALNTLGAPASVSPAQVTKATETFYDDDTFNTTFPQATAPTTGNVTMTRQASGGASGAFSWQTETRDTYDTYGRVEDSYDADGNETVTSYTVNAAGLTTGMQVADPPTTYTNPAGTVVTTTHVSSQILDPTRNLMLTSTDENGVVTTGQYDALGRLTSVWKDSRPTTDTANITYAYTVSNSSVSGVVTQTLNEEGNYVPSVTIYDSLGRVRQTQTLATTTSGVGRLITDTLYDSRGWVSQVNTDYYDDSSAPALSLVTAASNQVPDQDDYVYDGIGRQVEDISEDDAKVVSTTVTVYNGDSTTVIPDIPGSAASGQIPSDAGTVQTTQVNPLGQTTALVQYTANPSVSIPSDPATGTFYISGGTPDATTYAYDAQGEQDTTMSGGDSWTETYNLLGQETQSADPSGGTTTMTYDPDGNLLQSQDADGSYLSWTYDQLGRKTAEYAAPSSGQVNYTSASSPGNQMASWVYDNANDAVTSMKDADGQVTTETSYASGYAYTIQQIGFNVFGESTGEVVEIPAGAPGSAMGSDYVFTSTYQPVNGTPLKSSYPAGGGLPAETVTYSTTSALDLPSAVGGLDGYAEQTSYTAYGQVEQTIIGAGSDEAAITDTYDPHTGSLTDQLVTRSGDAPIDGSYTGSDLDNTSYTYNTASQITSETDQRLDSAASTETQCYAYTTQQQLAEAWTATDNCAATPTTTSDSTVGDPLGTSSEYFQSFTYNAAGQRASETALDPATGTFATTTYGYSASQPTALTSTSTTGAVTASTSYGYNADGQQTTRDATIGDQTLTWNSSGQLTGVTSTATGAQDASYVYGPDGSLLSQTDGSATTLYLPGEQLTDNNGTITGIRYYALPSGATAVRTGPGDDYYFEVPSDEHGTNTLYLDYTAQNPTWRQFDPFGNPRGITTTWIDNRAFLNDVTDPATSLTDIGARWYDPATGTFISLDPVLETGSPLQLNGYTYAADDPVTGSDPTGHMEEAMNGGGGTTPSTSSATSDLSACDANISACIVDYIGGDTKVGQGGGTCSSSTPGCSGYNPDQVHTQIAEGSAPLQDELSKDWSLEFDLGPASITMSLEASMNTDTSSAIQFNFKNGIPDSVNMNVPGTNMSASVPVEALKNAQLTELGYFCRGDSDSACNFSQSNDVTIGGQKFTVTTTVSASGDMSIDVEWDDDFKGTGISASGSFTAEYQPRGSGQKSDDAPGSVQQLTAGGSVSSMEGYTAQNYFGSAYGYLAGNSDSAASDAAAGGEGLGEVIQVFFGDLENCLEGGCDAA